MTGPRQLGLVGVLIALLLTLIPLSAVGAQAEQGVDESTGLEGASACFRDSKHLIVSLVVDESRSLSTTDPDAERVDAALAAVDGLAELGSSIDGAVVEITVGVFGDPYLPLLPFTPIDGETIPEIRGIIDTLGERRFGTETDIVTAVADARDGLNDRASEISAESGASPCSVMLLFTDGDYNLEKRGGERAPTSTTKFYASDEDLFTDSGIDAAMARGVDALCREDGIMDTVRADDIAMVSVMLAEPGGRADSDLLRALTLGSAGELTCGRPNDTIRGSYLAAGDPDELIARFHELATHLNGGAAIPGDAAITVCDDEPCPEGTRTVEVDPLTRRIRLLALTPHSDMAVHIDGPAGRTVVSEAGEFTVGEISGTAASVADRGLTIDLDRPDDDTSWTGTWTVSVSAADDVDDTPGQLQIYLYSDLVLELDVGELVRGEIADFHATLVLPEALDGDLAIEAATVSVDLEDPLSGRAITVDLGGPPAGPYTGTVTVPDDLRSNALRASASIDVRHGSGGRSLAHSDEETVLVRRSGAAVQFSPAVLDWPTLTGDRSVTATLLASAGPVDGCVWFEPATLAGPVEAGPVQVTYAGRDIVGEDDCIEVPAGSEVPIDIVLRSEERASGSVRGHVVIHERTGKEETVTDLAVHGRLHRGVDEARRMMLVAVLVIAGILLPVALLYLVNAISARFQRLDAVQGAVLPVRVRGATIELLEGERPRRFALHSGQFESLADRGSSRDFTFGGIRFRARPARNPFGGIRALAAPVGGAERLRGRVGRKVELEAGLAGSWVFLLDPDRTLAGQPGTAVGRLIAFSHQADDDRSRQRLAADITRRLPATAEALGDAVWDKTVRPRRRPADEPDEPAGAVEEIGTGH